MTVDNPHSLASAEPLFALGDDHFDDEDLVAIEGRWGLGGPHPLIRSQADRDLLHLVRDVRRLLAERERLVEEVARYRVARELKSGRAVTAGDRCGPGAFRPPGGGDAPEAA